MALEDGELGTWIARLLPVAADVVVVGPRGASRGDVGPLRAAPGEVACLKTCPSFVRLSQWLRGLPEHPGVP